MKMVGIHSVSSMMKTGDVGSQAEYPRASKVLRIPPLGNEEASGSCCTSSLPLNSSTMPPLKSCSTKASCFSAVPSVRGWNQWERRAFLNHLAQLQVGFERQVLEHFFLVEDVLAIVVRRTFGRCFHLYG